MKLLNVHFRGGTSRESVTESMLQPDDSGGYRDEVFTLHKAYAQLPTR